MKRLGEDKLPEGGNKRWTQTEEPCWEDFKEDLIPLPKDLPKTILKFLEEGFCTIAGPKNTGKTWLCYGVGFKLEKEKKLVWYIDDKDFKVDPVLEYVKGFIKEKTCYLIVEDCHRNPEETQKLLNESRQIGKENLRVLFTTEKTEEYILKDVNKIKLPDDLSEGSEYYAKNIIEKFLEIEELRKYVSVADIENTAKRGAKNLSRLSQCLKTWVREKCFERGIKLSEMIERVEEEKQPRELLKKELLEKLPFLLTIEGKLKENTRANLFPTEEDLKKGGLVYFDEKANAEIEEILESERYCLLCGPPSSRKTTFLLSLGLYFREAKGYSVFYSEVDEDWKEWKDLLTNIKICDDEKTLFIFDDCHKSPDTAGKFVNKVKINMSKAKFLFASRKISKGAFSDQNYNYFNKLKLKGAWTELKYAFEGVIKQHCVCHKIENCEELIGDIDKIIETCAHKFLFLNHLLQSWDPQKEILSEVPKEMVYEEIYYSYLQQEYKRTLLTKFSAVHQFEISILPEFLDSEGINVYGNTDLEKNFTELKEKEGLIYEKISKRTSLMYYTVHDDSSFARLILEAADHFNQLIIDGHIKSKEEFSADILAKYLCRVKKNVLQLFRSIYETGEIEIGEKLVQNPMVISAVGDYLKYVNFRNISALLGLLRKYKIRETDKEMILSKETLEQWAKNLGERRNLIAFYFLLRELAIFKSEKAEEFLEIIKPKRLAEFYKKEMFKEEKSKTIKTLKSVHDILTKLSNKEFLREFLNKFSEREIIDLLNNSKHRQIYDFFTKPLPSTVRNAYRTFLEDYHSEEKILSHYLNSLYLFSMDEELEKELNKSIIPESLMNMFETKNIPLSENITITKENTNKWVIIDKEKENIYFLNREDKKLNIYKSSNLKEAGEFIHISYWVPKVKNAYEKFFEKYLPNKINKSSLEDIVEFIDKIRRAKSFEEFAHGKKPLIGKKLGARVIDNLPEEFISQKLEEAPLKSIQKLIRLSKEVERWDIVSNLINQIKPIKMREIIDKSEIKDLGNFIWNVSDGISLPVEYREIINDLDLTEKIRKSPLKDVNFFLWVLFQTVGESQRVFSEDTLINTLKRDDANIGNKLWLVGIFDFADHDLTSRAIKTSKFQAILSESELEFKNWLEKGRFSERSPFKVALILKGFKAVDEVLAFSFLNDNFELKEEIINNLKKAEIKNEKSEKLINEVLDWLLSQEVTKNRKRSVLESSSNSVEGESE